MGKSRVILFVIKQIQQNTGGTQVKLHVILCTLSHTHTQTHTHTHTQTPIGTNTMYTSTVLFIVT